jgi:1-acyl-sn-glycerol-3-phosphate acyltransferase
MMAGEFMKERWKHFWYELLYYPTAFIAMMGFSLRVRGRERVPQQGGLLVIANHQSFLDPPLIGIAVRRHLNYLARSTLFDSKPLRWLIESLGAVPINQESVGTAGIKTSLALLKEGRAVLVFPEGSRTPDGTLHPLKPGVVVLIRRAGVPILPVGIAGADQAWPTHRPRPRFSPLWYPSTGAGVAVVVGKPISSKTLADLPPEETLARLHAELLRLHHEAEKLRRK